MKRKGKTMARTSVAHEEGNGSAHVADEFDTFEIEEDVRLPTRVSSGTITKIVKTLDRLNPGQSFKAPGKASIGATAVQSYYRSANGYFKPGPKNEDKSPVLDSDGNPVKGPFVKPTHPERAGRKFRTRGEPAQDGTDYFRVWRVE